MRQAGRQTGCECEEERKHTYEGRIELTGFYRCTKTRLLAHHSNRLDLFIHAKQSLLPTHSHNSYSTYLLTRHIWQQLSQLLYGNYTSLVMISLLTHDSHVSRGMRRVLDSQ